MVNKVPQSYAMLQGLEDEDAIADPFIDKIEEEGNPTLLVFPLLIAGYDLADCLTTSEEHGAVSQKRNSSGMPMLTDGRKQ